MFCAKGELGERPPVHPEEPQRVDGAVVLVWIRLC